MPKLRVRGGKLTVTIPENIREEVAAHDGEEIEVSAEAGRIVLTMAVEEPLQGELEALDEAEEEFSLGKTRRLDDILHAEHRGKK